MSSIARLKNKYPWFFDAMAKSAGETDPEKEIAERFRVITPELAAYMLTLNTPSNRVILAGNLDAQVKQIRNGNFIPTNQNNITISSSGLLIDGQHRLRAIVETQIPTKLHCYFGCPDYYFKHFDRGAPRKSSDDLKTLGYKNGKDLTALARMIMNFEKGRRLSVKSMELTDYIETNLLIDLAQRAVSLKLWKLIPPTSTRAAFYIISSKTTYPEKVNEFFEKIVNGNDISIGNAVWALREKAMRNDGFGLSISNSKPEIALKFCAAILLAWNSWILGKPITGKKAKFEWEHLYTMPIPV